MADTKLNGDIAEQSVILYALTKGWGVSKPVGDRLPYDLILDVNGILFKIQVKYAWFDKRSQNYIVDNRRTKTNRRIMLREKYKVSDFDFAVIYCEGAKSFWIMPVEVFINYAGPIHLVVCERQRKAKSDQYREAWSLIEKNEIFF